MTSSASRAALSAIVRLVRLCALARTKYEELTYKHGQERENCEIANN